ncbi:MAG: hypothetical protein CSA70_02380 [Rhodobacterales bacterium]|nr:MAG: hypothetical protein CSA70_02380 [Rhodobacterales bacterium]
MEVEPRLAIAGFLLAHPNWDGVAVVVGDPTHWAQISADEVVSFQSFLTLRIAAALGARGAVDGGGRVDGAAMAETLSRPERLAAHLASAEIGGAPGAALGHLIGAELGAARPYWLGQQVVVLGTGAMAAAYAAALEAQGVPVHCAEFDNCVATARARLAQ